MYNNANTLIHSNQRLLLLLLLVLIPSVVKIPRVKNKSWNSLKFALSGCVGESALDGDRTVALNKN